jgi:energy-coupling factor transporter transmembrane protein EcfT
MPKIDLRTPLGVEIGDNYIRGCDFMALIILIFSILFTAMCMKIWGSQPAAFIGLTFILIVVMFWQGFRSNPELRILPFRIEKKEGELTEPPPILSIGLGFRRLKFKGIIINDTASPMAYFDIGNVGVHDLTTHEFRVHLIYPKEIKFFPTHLRETLRCGERYSGRTNFLLLPDRNPLDKGLYIFRVLVYTAMGGKKRLLIAYRRNNTIYYCDPLREWGVDFKKLKKKLDESSNFL